MMIQRRVSLILGVEMQDVEIGSYVLVDGRNSVVEQGEISKLYS
jgi:hypothetical protein